MSQTTALRAANPGPRPVPLRPTPGGSPAPRLRVVQAPMRRRSSVGIAAVCVALLVGGLLSILVLNLSLERGSYVLARQTRQITALEVRQQMLQEQLTALRAPSSLAKKAQKLGMVPADRAAFVDPRTGKVLGSPAPGVASQTPKSTPGSSKAKTASTTKASARGTAASGTQKSTPRASSAR